MANDDERMTDYLLGELPEAEQAELESHYFADAALVDRLIQAETELLDQYAHGRLSPEMRERVLRRYLAHPTRRERLKFAEALAIETDRLWALGAAPERSPRTSNDANVWLKGAFAWWSGPGRAVGLSMAAASLVLVATAGWLFVERIRLREELDRTHAASGTQDARERELQQQLARARATADRLTTELDGLRAEQSTPSSAPTPTVVSLFLTVGGVRGADADIPRTLRIPPGTEQVRLQVTLNETEYARYQVVLQPIGGKEILHRQGLQPQRTTSGWLLVVTVPASSFAPGDYMLTSSESPFRLTPLSVSM